MPQAAEHTRHAAGICPSRSHRCILNPPLQKRGRKAPLKRDATQIHAHASREVCAGKSSVRGVLYKVLSEVLYIKSYMRSYQPLPSLLRDWKKSAPIFHTDSAYRNHFYLLLHHSTLRDNCAHIVGKHSPTETFSEARFPGFPKKPKE